MLSTLKVSGTLVGLTLSQWSTDTDILIDFKTSKGVYDEMKYQLCAYRQAYNEMLQEGQETIENMAILHLDKLTGEPTFKPIEKDVDRMTTLFNFLTNELLSHEESQD